MTEWMGAPVSDATRRGSGRVGRRSREANFEAMGQVVEVLVGKLPGLGGDLVGEPGELVEPAGYIGGDGSDVAVDHLDGGVARGGGPGLF
jgi:hypothetical protein